MHALPLAMWGAAALAMVSAGFGAVVARAVWADDLKQSERTLEHAKEMDRIRDETEVHLRRQIKALEEHIAILKQMPPSVRQSP